MFSRQPAVISNSPRARSGSVMTAAPTSVRSNWQVVVVVIVSRCPGACCVLCRADRERCFGVVCYWHVIVSQRSMDICTMGSPTLWILALIGILASGVEALMEERGRYSIEGRFCFLRLIWIWFSTSSLAFVFYVFSEFHSFRLIWILFPTYFLNLVLNVFSEFGSLRLCWILFSTTYLFLFSTSSLNFVPYVFSEFCSQRLLRIWFSLVNSVAEFCSPLLICFCSLHLLWILFSMSSLNFVLYVVSLILFSTSSLNFVQFDSQDFQK